MIHRNRAQSSSLFLMELIIAILFFTIFSAVCVQCFAKAHLMNEDSYALNHAVSECSGAMEVIRTSDGVSDSLALLEDLYPNGEYRLDAGGADGVEACIYYDADFKECAKDKAKYTMSINMDLKDQMVESKAVVKSIDSKSKIYDLSTTHHIARRTR